jgi:hypothetical protein
MKHGVLAAGAARERSRQPVSGNRSATSTIHANDRGGFTEGMG